MNIGRTSLCGGNQFRPQFLTNLTVTRIRKRTFRPKGYQKFSSVSFGKEILRQEQPFKQLQKKKSKDERSKFGQDFIPKNTPPLCLRSTQFRNPHVLQKTMSKTQIQNMEEIIEKIRKLFFIIREKIRKEILETLSDQTEKCTYKNIDGS